VHRIRDLRKGIELEEDRFREVDLDVDRLDESPVKGPVPVVEKTPQADTNLSAKPSADTILSDSLLASCRRTTWVPDAEMLISFDAELQAHGTEELRSLRSRLYRIRKEVDLKSILVASALPKEGRSWPNAAE